MEKPFSSQTSLSLPSDSFDGWPGAGDDFSYSMESRQEVEDQFVDKFIQFAKSLGLPVGDQLKDTVLSVFRQNSWGKGLVCPFGNGLNHSEKELVERFNELITILGDGLRCQPQNIFNHPEKIYQYFQYMKFLDKECLKIGLLKSQQLVQTVDIVKGTQNQILLTPREIFAPALRLEVEEFFIVHNHPSGNIEPSEQDFQFTRKIDHLSRNLDLKLIDHIIIGDGYYSFKMEGVI